MRAAQYAGIAAALVPFPLIPVVLAIIDHESGGIPGVLSYAETRFSKTLPGRYGKPREFSRAMGLMQTIPLVVENFNKAHPERPAYWEDMTGTGWAEARKQIEVGTWALKKTIAQVQNAIGDRSLSDNVLAFSLASYAIGIGRILDTIGQLRALGYPADFVTMAAVFPELGKPQNRPIEYVEAIFRTMGKVKSGTITKTGAGAAIAAIAVSAALLWAAVRVNHGEKRK